MGKVEIFQNTGEQLEQVTTPTNVSVCLLTTYLGEEAAGLIFAVLVYHSARTRYVGKDASVSYNCPASSRYAIAKTSDFSAFPALFRAPAG